MVPVQATLFTRHEASKDIGATPYSSLHSTEDAFNILHESLAQGQWHQIYSEPEYYSGICILKLVA